MRDLQYIGLLSLGILFAPGCTGDGVDSAADTGHQNEDGMAASTEDQHAAGDSDNLSDDGGINQEGAGSDPDGGFDGADNCVIKDNCQTLSQCANACGINQSCLSLCKATACQQAIDDFSSLATCTASNCVVPCVTQPDQNQCLTCVSQYCTQQMNTCSNQICSPECSSSDADGGMDGGDGHGADGAGDQDLQNCLAVLACLQASPTNPACRQNVCPNAVSLAQAFVVCSGQACLGSCASKCGSWCSGLNTQDCQTCVTQACSQEMADCIADNC